MKTICSSCKAIIDTDKHDFCPKCGANFVYGERLKLDNSANVRDEFSEQQEELNRRQIEQQMERREKAAQDKAAEPKLTDNDRNAQWEEHRKYHQKNAAKKADKKATGKKNGCIGCFAVAIFFVFGMGNVLEDVGEDIDLSDVMENIEDAFSSFVEEETADYTTAYNWDEEIPAVITAIPDKLNEIIYSTTTQDEYDTTPNTALTGETACTDTYALTLKEVTLYENEFFKASEGYVYMSFYLSLQNISDSDRFFFNALTLEADGTVCNMAGFSGLFLPTELAPDEYYESKVIFEVPKDAVFLDLHYGDEVTLYAISYDVEGYEPDFGYEYDESGEQEVTTTSAVTEMPEEEQEETTTEEKDLPLIIR